MRVGAFTIAAALLCGTGAATPPPATIVSPCECHDNHGKGRWAVKNDPSTPPTDASAIQAVTPSDVYGWPGMDVQLTWQSARTGRENDWYKLTGRVVAVKVEADDDLHLALKMRLVTSRELLSAKYQQSLSGVRYAQLFLVGRGRDFLCTFAQQENLRSTKP